MARSAQQADCLAAGIVQTPGCLTGTPKWTPFSLPSFTFFLLLNRHTHHFFTTGPVLILHLYLVISALVSTPSKPTPPLLSVDILHSRQGAPKLPFAICNAQYLLLPLPHYFRHRLGLASHFSCSIICNIQQFLLLSISLTSGHGLATCLHALTIYSKILKHWEYTKIHLMKTYAVKL